MAASEDGAVGGPAGGVRRSGGGVALVIASAVAAWHFSWFEPRLQPLVSDVRYYLYFAMRTAAGDVPHLDLFDNKTQLATFLGAVLYRVGEQLGVDPLLAIRFGFLALAAFGAVSLHAVVRGIWRSSVAGLFAVLAVASFGLLGALPALGNVAKLAMMVATSGMALAAWHRRWGLAGALGVVAFWDWQIGGVAWLAALVTAVVTEREEREPALRRVAIGGMVGALPFLSYYAANGALGACFDQTIVASFFRGASAMDKGGFAERWARIEHLVEVTSPGRVWLVAASLAGIPVALALLWRLRRDARLRLLLPMTLVHLAVLAFSAIDFQWNGDLFAIEHGLAFFQALLWGAIWSALVRLTHGLRAERALRIALGVALVGAAVWVCRPGAWRARFELDIPLVKPGVTLADQVEVAERLRPRFESERFLLAEHSELLFLLRAENPVPFVYWNDATWSRYRESPDEPKDDTLARLVRERQPDFFAYKKRLQRGALGAAYPLESFTSDSGRYVVYLQTRRDE